MLIKKAKVTFLGLIVLTSISNLYAGDFGGGNGGDSCENRIKIIQNDIESWIFRGGANGLELPGGLAIESYSRGILKAISKTKVSCPSKKINIGQSEKTCRNFTDDEGEQRMECNFDRFYNKTSEEDQYRLIHHEYAGLAGFEVNNGEEESRYFLSNQLSAFLEDKIVKRLSIGKASKTDCELRRTYVAVFDAIRFIGGDLSRTEFKEIYTLDNLDADRGPLEDLHMKTVFNDAFARSGYGEDGIKFGLDFANWFYIRGLVESSRRVELMNLTGVYQDEPGTTLKDMVELIRKTNLLKFHCE